jgi:hypothetical protein
MPDKQASSEVRLAPDVAASQIHDSNFFKNLASRKSQSMFFKFANVIGTPKYFIGKFPS